MKKYFRFRMGILAFLVCFGIILLPSDAVMPEAQAGGPTTIQLTASANGSSIDLSWNAPINTSGLTGYYIYRSTTSGAQSSTPYIDFPILSTSYSDRLPAAGTYYYIVRPVYNNSNPGSPSNEASATVGLANQSSHTAIVIFEVGSTTMYVNGSPQIIDAPPEIVERRVYVPLRALVEPLGARVSYNPNNSQVDIVLDKTSISLWVGSSEATVNGTPNTMDGAPYLSNSRTMLPLRFVSENLGCQVEWDSINMRVTIRYGTGLTTPGANNANVTNSTPTSNQGPTTGSNTASAIVDYSGTWKIKVDGEEVYNMVLRQTGSTVTGYWGSSQEDATWAVNGTVAGNKLHATLSQGNGLPYHDFDVTMNSDSQSFDGVEHYSNPEKILHGSKI